MNRPLLLDLYCGAGGTAMGYSRAGFDIIGVDIKPQSNYPFEFMQGDVLNCYLTIGDIRNTFDAVHASPPCQFYSQMSTCRPGLADSYPELITPTRELLQQTGLPWVIENVPRARKWMNDPITLCGQMFELDLYRHRLFESNIPLRAPSHPKHVKRASRAGHWIPGTIMSVSGHAAPIAHAREIMGIDWTTREELKEAIPPAYTEYIGAQLLQAIEAAA